MWRLEAQLARLRCWDLALCMRFNDAVRIALLRKIFRIVSRLGDGIFWYMLMLLLLASGGTQAVPPVVHMIVTGLACTWLYKWLKSKTSRPRPYQVVNSIFAGADPLDRFSFPSGHTLHAVAFSIIAIAYYPALAWLLVSFSVLVAISRLVLGLHYPSDVLAGAGLGALVAQISLQL